MRKPQWMTYSDWCEYQRRIREWKSEHPESLVDPDDYSRRRNPEPDGDPNDSGPGKMPDIPV